MPLILFLLAVTLFATREYFERRTRKNRYTAWEENEINGYREYLYAWHYYWEDVLPMVYAEMRKRNIPSGGVPYGDGFKKVSAEMFGKTAEGYALYLARKRSQAEGNYIYTKVWVWDEYHQRLSDTTKKERSLPAQYQTSPGLYILHAQFHEPLLISDSVHKDPTMKQLLPDEDDRRRKEFLDFDGRWKPLHFSKY